MADNYAVAYALEAIGRPRRPRVRPGKFGYGLGHQDTIALGHTGCRHAVPGLGAMTTHLDQELRMLERVAGL